MDRSVWFCTSPDEATWQHLGYLAGLDPLEHQWWAQDIDGEPAFEPAPLVGKRYTLPNRVYILMGGASIYEAALGIPYIETAIAWALDFLETAWAPVTRPIGAAIVFRPDLPENDGYKVSTIRNLTAARLAALLKSPDTYGIVYFGHGNTNGLTVKGPVHCGFATLCDIRHVQHHLLGKAVLNSCRGDRLARQITSPTGVPKGHAGSHHPPFHSLYW